MIVPDKEDTKVNKIIYKIAIFLVAHTFFTYISCQIQGPYDLATERGNVLKIEKYPPNTNGQIILTDKAVYYIVIAQGKSKILKNTSFLVCSQFHIVVLFRILYHN